MNVLILQYKKVSQSITIIVKDTLDGKAVDTIEKKKIAYFLTLDVSMIPIYRNGPNTSAFSFHH